MLSKPTIGKSPSLSASPLRTRSVTDPERLRSPTFAEMANEVVSVKLLGSTLKSAQLTPTLALTAGRNDGSPSPELVFRVSETPKFGSAMKPPSPVMAKLLAVPVRLKAPTFSLAATEPKETRVAVGVTSDVSMGSLELFGNSRY
jgi:hypothetical protein